MTVRALLVVLVGALALALSGDDQPGGAEVYRSRLDLQPPELTVEASMPGGSPRYFFVAPWRGDGQAGPMIVDGRGELVWFHPVPAEQEAMDLRVQRYQGRPVLTWWQGHVDEDGYGHGEYVIADRSYREIARFRPADGRLGDFHEFTVTARDTALITVYRPVTRDLSRWGGSARATVLESIVQEIDIETGRALLDWRALDHVDPAESHEPIPSEPDEVYDHFHVNSIDVDHDGNLLISARHTDTVYKIDRDDGRILWRLGGPRSDFALGPGARFYAQHDARRQPNGDITLFDNSNPPQVRDHSRAIRLRLDPAAGTAELVNAVRHPLQLSSESQGNAQTLPNGELVVGWGSQPYFSRFTPAGGVRFDAHFPPETDVYRAYQAGWDGRPRRPPAIAVDDADNGTRTVYASWNGATEVTGWQLLAGPRPERLQPVKTTPRRGFETPIVTETKQPYVAVRATGESGVALATSRAVHVRR